MASFDANRGAGNPKDASRLHPCDRFPSIHQTKQPQARLRRFRIPSQKRPMQRLGRGSCGLLLCLPKARPMSALPSIVRSVGLNHKRKPVREIWQRFPSQDHVRKILEGLFWAEVWACLHRDACGKDDSIPLRGKSSRLGPYPCPACWAELMVTIRTPLHAAKLELRVWIAAILLVLTTRERISFVLMRRLQGVSRRTAWRLGHAMRKMMDARGPRPDASVPSSSRGTRRSWPDRKEPATSDPSVTGARTSSMQPGLSPLPRVTDHGVGFATGTTGA